MMTRSQKQIDQRDWRLRRGQIAMCRQLMFNVSAKLNVPFPINWFDDLQEANNADARKKGLKIMTEEERRQKLADKED